MAVGLLSDSVFNLLGHTQRAITKNQLVRAAFIGQHGALILIGESTNGWFWVAFRNRGLSFWIAGRLIGTRPLLVYSVRNAPQACYMNRSREWLVHRRSRLPFPPDRAPLMIQRDTSAKILLRMVRRFFVWMLLVLFNGQVDKLAMSQEAKPPEFFRTHCVRCHDEQKQEAEFRLDNARRIRRRLSSGMFGHVRSNGFNHLKCHLKMSHSPRLKND